MKLKRKKGRQILIFLASFLGYLGVFFCAAFFVTGVFPTENALTTNDGDLKILYKKTEPVCILLIGSLNKTAANTFITAQIDANLRKITVSGLDATKTAAVNGHTDTLSGHYSYGGALEAKLAVSEITGTNIERYIYTNTDGLKSIIDLLGGVVFDVPESIEHHDPENSLNISLAAGGQNLSGSQAAGLARYTFRADKNIETSVQCGLVCALINQYLTGRAVSASLPLFQAAVGIMDTDIGIRDYEIIKGMLLEVAKGDGQKAEMILFE